MSDVSAVCLTLGEGTTGRALESVRRQTRPIAETVVVEGVTPFHRAFNLAVSRVRTPLFVQVDADMVLDPGCVAALGSVLAPDVGVVAGLLRDPLLGKVPAVKLFRTACFDGTSLPGSIAPDVDFYRRAATVGWSTVYALGPAGRPAARRHTFGEHLPSYTPLYTYSTYYILGARYRYLRDAVGLAWRLGTLAASAHPLAALARVALGHGVFCRRRRDAPKSSASPAEAARAERLLASTGRLELDEAALLAWLSLPPASRFRAFHALGARLARAEAGATVARCLALVARATARGAWLAEAGLAHGLLARRPSPAAGAFEGLAGLLPER